MNILLKLMKNFKNNVENRILFRIEGG